MNSDAASLLESTLNLIGKEQFLSQMDISEKTLTRWRNKPDSIPRHALLAMPVLKSRPASRQAEFTFIDLFAGVGGIRLGFEQHGGQCVFTSEWNKFSQQTYRENFPDDHGIAGDITAVEARDIPDHDVLLAGFPCQPFSIAGVSKKNSLGKAHGFECETQGTLFFDVARIIKEKRPRAFLLENVKNLRSHDKGNTFRVIMETLQAELGYQVQARIIDGKHFTPQHRERILIVGFREPNDFDFSALSLPALATAPKLSSILHPQNGCERDPDHGRYLNADGTVQARYTLTPNLWQYLQDYAAKHRAAGNGFGFGLVGPNDTTRTLSARYHKDGSEILIAQPDHPEQRPRRLTPRECARLMGFPDSYRIPVSDTQAYRQFGNSVVVPVMATVAGHMRPYLSKKSPSTGHVAEPGKNLELVLG